MSALRDHARRVLTRAAHAVIRNLPSRRVRWGTLRRTAPFSSCYGWDRGLPVDRFYIEAFLAAQAEHIRGDVLEVRSADYTTRFGADRVTASHVLDIDATNRTATVIADLCASDALPADAYDCVLLTQTLQFLADDTAALRNAWRSLRPDGTLLLTAPCVSRQDHESPQGDYWRYTAPGLRRRLAQACPQADIHVESPGNVLAGVAFLLGLSVQELTPSELTVDDPFFPLIVCARVRRGS
jgi:SAM-dependent methyltransferase